MERISETISGEIPEASNYSKCQTCGEEIDRPIFAKVTLAHSTEEYIACPKCLSKMQRTEMQEDPESDELATNESAGPINMEHEKYQKEESTEDSTCPYQFGYLRKHQRNLPIPEECLICKKMIECRI